MFVKNLKSSRNLFDVGSSSDIQEVGGFTSVQLDDVHGGHGQSSSVDHTSDVSVQSHVVQSSFHSLEFVFIDFFGTQTIGFHLKEVFLSELSVIININFSVNAVEFV